MITGWCEIAILYLAYTYNHTYKQNELSFAENLKYMYLIFSKVFHKFIEMPTGGKLNLII